MFLEVYINGNPTSKIVEFKTRDAALFARTNDLRDIGLPVQAIGEGLIELASVPGITWRLDLQAQTIYITIQPRYLPPTFLRADGRDDSSLHRAVESATGVMINYDTLGNFANGQAGVSGTANIRAFSPRGAISSSWLGYAGAASGGTGTNEAIRLDSTYQFADVDSMRRYSIGDFITSGLSWTRPIRLTGAQLRSDFSTRPDLVTFPLPTINGLAAVPSTVSILTDGNQVLSSQIQPGPFEVTQLPVVIGAGNISLSVTNALGQQVTVTQPFYASSAMLAPKLQTFAVQVGLVRLNWGTASNDYGKFAGSALYRRGLNSKFTIEGSIEGAPGAISGGIGGFAAIGTLGVLNFSSATSAGPGHTGEQISIGAQRIGRIFSIGASMTLASKDYTDVAALNGSPVSTSQINGNISYSARKYGNIGAAYGDLTQALTTSSSSSITESPPSGSVIGGQRTRIFSANYALQIRRVTLYATEFRSYSTGSSDSGFQAGLTIPLGSRSSANVSGTSDRSAIFQVQQSASSVGDWGYEGYVSAGHSSREFGEVQYKSTYGMVTAGIDRTDGLTTGRVEAQGAVTIVDRAVFASNEIYDSFAVVDTGDIKHVRVLQENRYSGRTGSFGMLMVPNVRPFDLNHIAIDPTDIPFDATIDDDSRTFRPRDLSGVIVKFSIRLSHGALLHILDPTGSSLPLGTTATLRASRIVVPVGYDGDAFLQDLLPHNDVDIETPDGHHCTLNFDFKPVPGEIPVLGPFRCQEHLP